MAINSMHTTEALQHTSGAHCLGDAGECARATSRMLAQRVSDD